MRRTAAHGMKGARAQTAALHVVTRAARPIGYKLVQRATWKLARYFDPSNSATIHLNEDTTVRVSLDDGYWIKLLDPRFQYEPDLQWALDRLLTHDSYFLDCGANIGYWSLMVRKCVRATVAVEAGAETFSRMSENVRLSNAEGEIELVHAALWTTDGEVLDLTVHHRMHASSSLLDPTADVGPDGWTTEQVGTVSLRHLIERYCSDPASPIVIKLDVEGVESQVVEAALDILRERQVTLVYEDHGGHIESTVSQHLLDIGMVVLAEGFGHPLTIEEVRSVKKDPAVGYNFVACWPGQEVLARLGVTV